MAERTPRVLIVDDTEANRYATSRILATAGFEVVMAENGADALAEMRSSPDIVVLDINLPDMSGYEVVERMRRIPEHAAIPVLHLSASFTSHADQARGLERGANAYLTHPIEPAVFVATIRALLRSSAADRKLQEAAREWQATFDALNDAVFLLDENGVVQRANRGASALLSLDEHAVLGQRLDELLRLRFREDADAIASRVASRQRLDKTLARMDGRSFTVSLEPVHVTREDMRSVCVMEDVSERIAAEREREQLLAVAEQARFEAEEANRAKSEFLAVMSHELRTPLNAIGGYAQLLELGIRGPITDQQRADLDRIKRSQTYLLALINDVLNFAKIESGHLEVDIAPLDLNELLTGMSDFVQPQLHERGLTYSCHAGEGELLVQADREKVQQVLLNLLSNALKFTPAGGSIELRCESTESDAFVTVSDTGLGIAADKLGWIFEPFIQVDRRYKRQQEGIGLGLAISRELARAMGGDLTVQSDEGRGSMFMLRLPRVMAETRSGARA